MPNVADDALSTAEAHHRAWIVEIRLAFDRLGYLPQARQPA